MWGDIAIAFVIAFLAAFMTTPYTIKLARKLGAVDTPKDERRVNRVTMPRLGGLAIIVGFIVSVVYLILVLTLEKNTGLRIGEYWKKLLGFAVGGLIISIVCFIDDVRGVPAWVKLIFQIIAAVIVAKCGVRISSIDLPFLSWQSDKWISIIITIGWIVGITNAVNLIDGLDGLATGISMIACFSLLIIFSLNESPLISVLLITALGGALVGFLPYNFNPAKTFMGDTGSNFLGYSLAIISILGIAKTYTAIVIVAPLIVLALPVFDTIFAIFRRLIKGKTLKAVVTPDTNHLHHKMLKKGFTQKQTVLILYGISATFGMFAVVLMESGFWKAISFLILVALIIALGYKEFFKQKLIGVDDDSIIEYVEKNAKIRDSSK